MSRIIEGTVTAWATDYSGIGPHNVHEKNVENFVFSNAEMGSAGWTKFGVAQIRVELVDSEVMVRNKIEALNAEIRNTEAEAEARVTQLKGQIQNLLAITHQPIEGGAE